MIELLRFLKSLIIAKHLQPLFEMEKAYCKYSGQV